MPYIKASEWKHIQNRLKSASTPVGGVFDDLRSAVQKDSRMVGAATIGTALLNKVCLPFNCREDTFIMEKGESVRTQPFRLVDSKFNVVTKKTIERVLAETKVDEIQWSAENYDCDDIARKFVTRCADLGLNSVGRVMSWSGGHAFCIAVIQDGDDVDFAFIEPQTDQFVEPDKGKYSLNNALIVIS